MANKYLYDNNANSAFYEGQQYLVFEEDIVNGTKVLYPHGTIHNSLDDGMQDLLRKISLYEKYGRKFHLFYRVVPEWKEV